MQHSNQTQMHDERICLFLMCVFVVIVKANARHTCKTNVGKKAERRNTKTAADKMMLIVIDNLRLNVYECDEYIEIVFAVRLRRCVRAQYIVFDFSRESDIVYQRNDSISVPHSSYKYQVFILQTCKREFLFSRFEFSLCQSSNNL